VTRDAIVVRIGDVLREFFDDEGLVITDETTYQEVAGWDSFSQVQIVYEIEEAFGVRFDAADIMRLNTVALLADQIERLLPLS
jgi:acyl carrier protein